MKAVKTSKRALRRFLLDTQHLLYPYKEAENTSLLERVMHILRQLECVQIDPVSAVSPNQHLTLAARVPGYRPEILNQLLAQQMIFEYIANAACIIPMEDYPIFQPKRDKIKEYLQNEINSLGVVVEEVLNRLEIEGPLPAKAFQSKQIVHGYWDNQQARTKDTSHALNLLMDIGRIRVISREGNQRIFDLSDRTVPTPLLKKAEQIERADAVEAMIDKYLHAYRVFESSDPRFGWQKLSAMERRDVIERRLQSGNVIPVQVDEIKTQYFILASDLERLLYHESFVQSNFIENDETNSDYPIYFLPPLDNLLWSRKRLIDLFDFTYKWEIYTPAAKRVYGYYTMPILAGDRLIGRIDPSLDKKKKHLHVQLLELEPEVKPTDQLLKNLRQSLLAFAQVHGAEQITIEQNEPLITI